MSLTELLVYSTTGYEALSFMDGYSGYYQIQMAKEHEKLQPSGQLTTYFSIKSCHST